MRSRLGTWRRLVAEADDLKTLHGLIRELDNEGINWQKHELLHTVLDAVDMIPYSQVCGVFISDSRVVLG